MCLHLEFFSSHGKSNTRTYFAHPKDIFPKDMNLDEVYSIYVRMSNLMQVQFKPKLYFYLFLVKCLEANVKCTFWTLKTFLIFLNF